MIGSQTCRSRTIAICNFGRGVLGRLEAVGIASRRGVSSLGLPALATSSIVN